MLKKYHNRYEIEIFSEDGKTRLHLSRKRYGRPGRFTHNLDAFAALARLLRPDDVGFKVTWFWGGKEIVETGYVPLTINSANLRAVESEIQALIEERRKQRGLARETEKSPKGKTQEG